MTKEKLLERLKALEEDRIKASSIFEGAIQDTRYWLQQLEEDEKKQESISE